MVLNWGWTFLGVALSVVAVYLLLGLIICGRLPVSCPLEPCSCRRRGPCSPSRWAFSFFTFAD